MQDVSITHLILDEVLACINCVASVCKAVRQGHKCWPIIARSSGPMPYATHNAITTVSSALTHVCQWLAASGSLFLLACKRAPPRATRPSSTSCDVCYRYTLICACNVKQGREMPMTWLTRQPRGMLPPAGLYNFGRVFFHARPCVPVNGATVHARTDNCDS